MELKPRLCFLTREERGYGFHLHGERNKGGQFIRKVEPGSPADLSGLRAGDRVVEVNGENVENETHYQVVNLIRAVAHRTRLLVVDKETDEHLRARRLPVTEDGAVETGNLSPRPSPMSTPSASPLPRESAPWSPSCGRAHSPVQPVADALCPAPKPRPISSLLQHPAVSRTTGRPSLTSDPGDATELSSETPSQLPGATVELLPRVCHMVRGEHGYGFNLHSDKTRDGQFIRSVDPCSPAARADLRPQDRLVEVNGVSVEGLKHSDVVGLIHGGQEETSLLVVDPETDELFRTLGVTPASCHVREVYVDEPIVTQTIMSEPIVAKTIMSEPIVTKTIMIEPIVAKPVVKEPIGAKPFVNEPIVNEPIKGEAIVAEPIGNDPTENEPITNETILEDPIGDSALLTPSPTGTFKSRGPPPVINVTISNSPSSRSPKLRTYGSSGSQSSRSSTTQSELSSSDTSIPVPYEDERRVSDPFLESGLRLSPTAAEAKERARAKRTKKRAPPMDWSQKQQIFSNL